MRKPTLKTLCMAGLAFALGLVQGRSQGAGQALELRYTGISGSQIQNLTGNAKYPNSPDVVNYLTSLRTPAGIDDNYGRWVLGYIKPTTTGWYRFAVAGDDQTAFFLSTDDNPGNLVPVCWSYNWGPRDNFIEDFMRQSRALYLEAGNYYYFEVLMKEGGGGDHLTVGWIQLSDRWDPTLVPNGAASAVPGEVLTTAINPGPVSVRKDPASVSLHEGETAVFEALLDGDAPFTYQWKVNGALVGDPQITYCPRVVYTQGPVSFLDDGTTVSVVVSNNGGANSTESAVATISIVPDSTPPSLVSAIGAGSPPDTLLVTFSEPVDPLNATDPFNYAFDTGTIVVSATPDPNDGRLVTLTLDNTFGGVTDGATLTVSTVGDMAGNVAFDLTVQVIVNEGTIRRMYYDGIGGADLLSLVNNPAFPSLPSVVDFATDLSSPSARADNYGTRMQGYLRVGQTGDYYMAIATDDESVVYLSPDDDPAHKEPVVGCAPWANVAQFGKNRMQKTKVHLVAGQKHYIDVLHKEGGGGDSITVSLVPADGILSTADTLVRATGAPIPDGTGPIPGLYLNPYNELIQLDPNYPMDLTSEACAEASLSVVLTAGSPPLTFQWYDAGTDMPILDATNVSYSLPYPLTSGSYYCVVANDLGSVTSRVATVTVPAYETGPSIVGASTFDGQVVTVTFDRTVNPGQAMDPFNYFIVDPVTDQQLAFVTSATRLEDTDVPLSELADNGKRYVLVLDVPVTTDFKVQVAGVTDCLGKMIDPAGSEYLVQQWGYTSLNIGLELGANQPATNYPIRLGDVDVRVSGNDIWNNADEFNFIYKEITGDFDLKVHTPRLDRVNNWAKAGIMARVNLTPGSPHVYVVDADYTNPGEARIALGRRLVQDGGSSGWPSDPRPTIPRPLSWVRLKRVGNTFSAYYSTNGLYWTWVSSYDPSGDWGGVPETLYVGICTTSHNRNANTTAEYREFGPTTYPGIDINIVQQPTDVTTPGGTQASFSVEAEVVNGPSTELGYQWQRSDGLGGFTNIVGANSATLDLGWVTQADDGSQFRVVLKVPGVEKISDVATLTVTADTTAPQLLYAVSLTPTNVTAIVSEPLNDGANDPFAWLLDGGASVATVFIDPANPTRIDLGISEFTPLTPGQTYTLTAAVADVAGNNIDPAHNSATFTAFVNLPLNPQMVTVLPTDQMLPLGSLTERGFACRMVQTTNNYANDNDVAELVLAGLYEENSDWPFYEITPQGPNWAGQPEFIETGIINYDIAPTHGHLADDMPFPGIPNPAHPGTPVAPTEYMVMEAIAYLELQPGFHVFGVNSDDGFRVTPALSATDPANSIVLGEFNGGRGSADTLFAVIVTEPGLYPFRLLWEQGAGGANLEWWSWSQNPADGTVTYTAINDPAGIPAYLPPTGPAAPTLSIELSGGNVVISWPVPASGTDELQVSTDLQNWSPVGVQPVDANGVRSVTVPADQPYQFFRLVHTQ